MNNINSELTRLIENQKDNFPLEQKFFTDKQIFEEDFKHIFSNQWVFIGHISRIPNKGDFFITEIANESIIVVRDRGGDINCFYNVCRHRGSHICTKTEGSLRKQNAEWGLERLREHCDTILVIPNERLLEIEGVKDLPIASAFRVGDELLVRSITGVTELLTTDGMVNLDFEDLKAVIKSGSGVAMIGLGASSATNRAEEATLEALHSPLLELDTTDARGALINVVGGPNLTLGEAEKCAQIIQERISPHAKIIWGAAVDENIGDEIRVMLVLTGVKSEQIHGSSENRQLRALRNKSIEFVN